MEKTSATSEIGTISYDGACIKTDFAQRTKHRLSPTRTTVPLVKKRRETDKAMRKGRTYHVSRRVLWRNRHHLVFGSQNSYRRNSRNASLFGNSKEKEYENNEPPEVEDDHQWLLTGPEYSSDEAGDGPVPVLKIFGETVIDPDPQWVKWDLEFSSAFET